MYTYQQPLTKQYQTYNTVLVAALIKTFSVIINTYVYIKWISKFAIQFNFKVWYYIGSNEKINVPFLEYKYKSG